MQTITTEKAERLRQIELNIVEQWNSAEDHIDQVHDFAQKAVVAAWSVGRLLIEAKAMLGHGHFGAWLEQRDIPQPTASRYMALATNYSHVNDLPTNRRQAYLAIGLLPDKERVEIEGDTQLDAKPHYLTIINKWTSLKKRIDNGDEEIDFDKARKDFRGMFDWLKELYGA